MPVPSRNTILLMTLPDHNLTASPSLPAIARRKKKSKTVLAFTCCLSHILGEPILHHNILYSWARPHMNGKISQSNISHCKSED